MKKRILPNNKQVNYDLKEDQIKKNNDINLEYNIKKIKKEQRYTAILVCFFVALIVIVCIFVFSKIDNGNKNISQVVNGNLTTTFQIDENGIRSSISMRSINTKYYYYFTIKNNSTKKQKYIVYLEPDNAVIRLEGCGNKLAFYDTVLYRINDGEEYNLSLTHRDNKYIVDQGEIRENSFKKVKLEMYFSKDVEPGRHYHGLIKIKNIRS
ncbi:MAG: hypothetical protein IJL76_01700 [Bacilli bacterium]|nr:hypothetical protein [Bacilli bacterium]